MSKSKKILLGIISGVFILILINSIWWIITGMPFFFVRGYPEEYDFQAGSKWYASENEIYMEAVYEEKYDHVFLYGTMLSGEDLVNIEIYIDSTGCDVFYRDSYAIMFADCRVDKNKNGDIGDIILKDIYYAEGGEFYTTPDKIVLEKIE